MDTPQKRILIVDDEPALLKMMGVYLMRKGFAVTTIDSTDAAWAAVESGAELDAAVIDGSMRGLSAEELGFRILTANPSARILMASGYPVDMSRLEAAGAGRVEFVQKPFSPQSLAEALRRILAGKEENV